MTRGILVVGLIRIVLIWWQMVPPIEWTQGLTLHPLLSDKNAGLTEFREFMAETKEWFAFDGYASGKHNAHLIPGMPISTLPPYLRLLLVTDGTVTKSLEALFWEPVSVELDRQKWLFDAPPWESALSDPMDLLQREVFLRGQKSSTCYSFARSYINADCLEVSMREALLSERMGIGELLRSFYCEQYRKITDIGWYEGDPAVTNRVLTEDCVYRTYQVISQRKPLMQITEYFPASVFGAVTLNQPAACIHPY